MQGIKKSTPKEPCASCGEQGHHRANCKYRNFTCYSCGKAGLIADACRGKKTKLNNVEGTLETDVACDPFSTTMYKLSTNRHGINIPVEINGKVIQMELNTGAGVSIISKETFDKHFKHIQLEPCTAQLHKYTDDPIRVCGQFSPSVRYSNQCTSLPLLVVEGSGPSLFGGDLLAKVKLEWEK